MSVELECQFQKFLFVPYPLLIFAQYGFQNKMNHAPAAPELRRNLVGSLFSEAEAVKEKLVGAAP
jgi:hypothetical protein